MDGSRRARLAVLVVTLACGLTLAAAALVSGTQPARTGEADTIARTPAGLRGTSPVALTTVPVNESAGVPRTTPPPTGAGVATPPPASVTPPAASTVGRS